MAKLPALPLTRKPLTEDHPSMSNITYLPGKEPDAREHRLIFKNIDREGWDNSIDCYIKDGGYEQLKKAFKMEPQAITNEVKTSGLRGRGGAGFPTG